MYTFGILFFGILAISLIFSVACGLADVQKRLDDEQDR